MSHLPEDQILGSAEPPPDMQPEPLSGRSPVLAGILSIIPGVGHFYVGLKGQGISYFLLAVIMVSLTFWARETHEFEVSGGLITAVIVLAALYWAWVITSAVFTAMKRRFAPNLGLVIILGFTYVLGWQATEIDLVKFFTEFSDTFSIFSKVLWPWDAAVEREEEYTVAGTGWMNPCPESNADLPEQITGDSSAPWITVEPTCGEFATYNLEEQRTDPGTPLSLTGGGFLPDTEIEIWWNPVSGGAFRPINDGVTISTTTDSEGNFSIEMTAPQHRIPGFAEGSFTHEIQARQLATVGNLHISEAFVLAIGRMIVTIFQAMMATTFGIVLALPLSFLAARNLMWHNWFTRLIYFVVRLIMNIARSIEPIIWGVIATVWVGLGPFAGVIALTIHTIAALGKLYSEAIESIDPGPIEAITATGANRIQSIMYAIVPQIIPPFLSFTIYRWDINVRMSTIIGFVGGGGIGQLLFQWINQSRWSSAGMAVWLIALTVALMDYGSAELRKRFV